MSNKTPNEGLTVVGICLNSPSSDDQGSDITPATESPTDSQLATKQPADVLSGGGKVVACKDNPASNNQSTSSVVPDESSQIRSTLALGQLIASNRPTAGSRLIANALNKLSKTVEGESVALRKEIAQLSKNLGSTLKTVFEEEREHRNMSAAGGINRRPMFGFTYGRRFPAYRRPQLARKNLTPSLLKNTEASSPVAEKRVSLSNDTTTTPTRSTVDQPNQNNRATKSSSPSVLRDRLNTILKNVLIPIGRIETDYDPESDTDSSDTE